MAGGVGDDSCLFNTRLLNQDVIRVLQGDRCDLRISRSSWKTSDYEPISVARSWLISVELVAPMLPLGCAYDMSRCCIKQS